MCESHKELNQHDVDDHKEVSSTQTTTESTIKKVEHKEKVIQQLPETNVKPRSEFKLFSFTGDNCGCKIINWIRIFENLAKRVGWSEEEMKWNLSSYLEQEAFDFYVEHILTKDLDWKQSKQLMVQRFDQFEIEPFMEFLSHKWTPQIELKEYFRKMRALGIAAGLKEEDILAGLTRGLPVHLRSELSFVTSLQQWVAVAFCLQQRLEENGNNYNKHQNWKQRNRGHRNQRTNKQRNNHPSNMQSDHNMISSINNNDHHVDSQI